MEPGNPDYVIKDQPVGDSTEPTLANALACSGAFIQLYNSGVLQQVNSIILELERALLEEQAAQYELSKINNLFWLGRFSRSNPDNFPAKLSVRAEKCKTRLSQAQAQISHLRSQLEAQLPGASAYIEIHRDLVGRRIVSAPRKRKLTAHRQLLEERNELIRLYRDEPTRGICERLDRRFPAGDDSPAPQFPRKWFDVFKVRTFRQAYRDPRCSPRVHSMFSRVLKGLRTR